MKKIRVLLADDHVLMRAGIRSLLEEIPEVEVVAEAMDGQEALAAIKKSRPDVALVDIAMPGLNGLEVAARAAQDYPQVRVIILSMHGTSEYVRRALQAGAKGYLRKDAEPHELQQSIEAAARGEIYLNQLVSQVLVSSCVQAPTDGSQDCLTPRQQEVLRLLAAGCATKEIAARLQISARTVETYRAQIMKRLDVHGLAGLVRYAVRMGLVSPEN